MAAPFVVSLEDNDGDFALMEFVFQECLGPVELRRATDGEQAVSLLKKSEVTGQLRPDLILLDVHTPRLNGFDVLQFIRSQAFIRDVPVVMFTSSADVREKIKAQALGAEDFITKPISLDGMLRTLNEVCTKYLKKGKDAVV